jgi:hypothetical protein
MTVGLRLCVKPVKAAALWSWRHDPVGGGGSSMALVVQKPRNGSV